MEIVVVVLLLLVVLAALAFAWTRRRAGGRGGGVLPGRGPSLRGRRGARIAARHDPMAEAVERHAMATDPQEAAEAELQLRAQANRVASELHAREAAALEADAGGPRAAHEPDQPDEDERPAYHDENGRPVYRDDRPRP